jgi:hypothetical protein
MQSDLQWNKFLFVVYLDLSLRMGKKTAKTGGSFAPLRKQLEKKVGKVAPPPPESDNESEESGNYMKFNKKNKDSDDEEDGQEIFNLALDKDDDDEVCTVDYLKHILCLCLT